MIINVFVFKFIVFDVMGAIAFIAVGITAAVRQSQLADILNVAQLGYRNGTFTACAVNC